MKKTLKVSVFRKLEQQESLLELAQDERDATNEVLVNERNSRKEVEERLEKDYRVRIIPTLLPFYPANVHVPESIFGANCTGGT